jgi:farnesyl-diphosphate farnesyltransferase
VRFGQGLQLVNILRDLPRDLRQGRCYLSAGQLGLLGLTPAELLQPASEPRFRPLYNSYLAQAEAHLAAGWAYTNALPFRCARVRLACAWPILIGLKTLRQLRGGNVLDPRHRIKITRGQVRDVLVSTVVFYGWPTAWESLADEMKWQYQPR